MHKSGHRTLFMRTEDWKQSKCPLTLKRTLKRCGTVKQLDSIKQLQVSTQTNLIKICTNTEGKKEGGLYFGH